MKRLGAAVAALALGFELLLGACSPRERADDASRGAGNGGQSSGGTNAAGDDAMSGAAVGGETGASGANGGAFMSGGATGGVPAWGAGGTAGTAGTAGSAGEAGVDGLGGVTSGGTEEAGVGGAGTAGLSGDETGGGAGAAITIPNAERGRLSAIRVRALALQNSIVTFWKNHGPDPQGGFHGELDRKGNATSATDKFVHAEARHLWAFSAWYRQKEPTPEVKAICDDLFDFLGHFYDRGDGRYAYSVVRNGASVTDSKKVMQAQSFVILASSEYGIAFDNQTARNAALALFKVIDAQHDEANGGYDQTNDAWSFAYPGAKKGMNLHMHLLESFTALYRATKDSLVRQRLAELVLLFQSEIAQPERYYHTEFDLAWNPLADPAVVEYGHDLQVFWLLFDALEVLGMASNPTILGELATIAEQAAARGFDGSNGYATNGTPGAGRQSESKVWWVQAEALNALLRLYLVTGDATNLDRIEATLSFVERAFLDPDYGELYAETSATGSVSDTRKGYEWKASYHTLRFALFLDLRIEGALTPSQNPQ